MAQAPKTLRVHWERHEIREPSGKVTPVMIPEIQLPELLLDGVGGGVVDAIVDNIAGEYVIVRVEPDHVTATPVQDDPRERLGQFVREGDWLYRWPDRGGRLEYLATLGNE